MKVTKPLKWVLKRLLWDIANFELGKKSEECNILVSKCIGCVEHNRVVMMLSKTMAKLRFSIGITT